MAVHDDGWSEATTTVTRPRPAQPRDVELAHRGVASFGGGGGPGAAEAVREFIRRYGWRAYALPILLTLTVVALLTAREAPPAQRSVATGDDSATVSSPSASVPVAPSTIPLKSDTSTGKVYNNPLHVGQLPQGGPYTKDGTGTFRMLKGTTKIVGKTGPLYRYDIEVENGITGIDLTAFAKLVDTTLDDPRSWSGHGVRLERVSSGSIDFHITLTSAMTVRKYCGYDIPVETSCYASAASTGTVNRVVLNDARWVRGASPYVGDLTAYRTYMINHEDGHALGHQHAHQCLPGGLAPVMMQQTFGLKSAVTGKNCGANQWPYPPGAKGAPGAEQPDTDRNNEYYIGD